jgi:hypothetical protein
MIHAVDYLSQFDNGLAVSLARCEPSSSTAPLQEAKAMTQLWRIHTKINPPEN